MIKRDVESTVRRLSKQYKIITIVGPRQSGKTTLSKAIFGPKLPHVVLENLDTRAFAQSDPRGFLKQYPEGAIFDEIQECPAIVSYLLEIVDNKKFKGRYVLTGSQNLSILQTVSQSLAGRTTVIDLLPLTLNEIFSEQRFKKIQLSEVLLKGCYPRLYDSRISPVDWYSDYLRTYVERDVRAITGVKDTVQFSRFLGLCAGRIGQILTLNDLCNDAGISYQTAVSWLSILEATYIVFRLPPHFENFSKRLIKSPKIYFYDTGLACRLLGIQSSSQMNTHPLRGFLFESFMVSEIKKQFFNRHLPAHVFYWRDHKGLEIDLIIENITKLIPVEIKSGATVASDFFDNLKRWVSMAKNKAANPFLIYGGDESFVRNEVDVRDWRSVAQIVQKHFKKQGV